MGQDSPQALTPLLLNEVQKQSAKFDSLRREVEQLEARLREREKRGTD